MLLKMEKICSNIAQTNEKIFKHLHVSLTSEHKTTYIFMARCDNTMTPFHMY